MLIKRNTCRLCDSREVRMLYKMPVCPPVDNYRFAGEPELELPAFPMDLYMCNSCGHAQLLDVVDPSILFGNYIYTSSSSPDLEAHFTAYAERIVSYARLSGHSLVVDIGSNDGLLLSKFKLHGVKVQGVDASRHVGEQAISNGIPTIISFLTPAVVADVRERMGLADVVCANNVFSHADDLRGFAECARDLLKPQGFFVFEVSYLKDLLDNKVIDYVYHEHLAHHSIKPLKSFFESLGMRLFNVERIVTKGGSIRCYAALANSKWKTQPVIAKMISEEDEAGLYTQEVFDSLKNEMDVLGRETRLILQSEIEQGRKVASYGASATTTVLNAILGVDPLITVIIDDNPARQGRLSPGHRIPVKSGEALKSEMPAVTLIAAWRFAELIISRNQDYLSRGGKFLVPLPNFRVITHDKPVR